MSFKFKHGNYERPTTATSPFEPQSIRIAGPRPSFNYIFPTLANDSSCLLPENIDTVRGLRALAAAMVANPGQDSSSLESTIPPVYTYWGQFIDHDITAMEITSGNPDITDANMQPMDFNLAHGPNGVIKNNRHPLFDLDCIYGDGPGLNADGTPTIASTIGMYRADNVRLTIGTNSMLSRNLTPNPHLDNSPFQASRDLPRRNKEALIGDSRNDENTIVSQFHLAMLNFHNKVADWVEQNEFLTGPQLFERAKELTVWHFQWLVVNDYLATIAKAGTANRILFRGQRHYNPPFSNNPVHIPMPLEFSVAAYRFGHTMVRGTYDFNKNFGRTATGGSGNQATFEDLFRFTGNGGFRGLPTLPNNWIIEWDRFSDKQSPFRDRFARKIDTDIAFPLARMSNEGNEPSLGIDARSIMKHLAMRNLLRGYALRMPTGQCIAEEMNFTPLSQAELKQGKAATDITLTQTGLLDKTPLWYYILKESEVRENGDTLGEVGSQIVCETLIGLIRSDPNAYLYARADRLWSPHDGVKTASNTAIMNISDLFKFAGVA